jgi:hypothetical protein
MDSDYIQYIANLINEDNLDLIVEEQIDYLTRKYGEQVDQELIQKAIDTSTRYAEKLLFGYINGDIDSISHDNIEQIKDLDPFKRETQKSEADIAFQETIQRAKQINRRHWQWITRIWKEDPNAEFDQSWFDYLQYADMPNEELLTKSTAEISAESEVWHEEEFANQDVGGEYTKSIEDEDAEQINSNWWIVPIYKEDAKIEGAKMQNCIGGICVPSANNHLFSLRDKFNNPKVSIEIQQTMPPGSNQQIVSSVKQIKGKQNKSPLQKYTLPVIKWLLNHPEHYTNGGTGDFWNIMPADKKLINTIVLKMARNMPTYELNLNHSIANYFSDGRWGKNSGQNVIDFITEDTADFLLSGEIHRGERHPHNATIFSLLNRASSDMLGTLLSMPAPRDEKSGKEVDSPKFVRTILTTGKVSKENLQSVLQDQNSSLITKAIIYAQYYPDELEKFMDDQIPSEEIFNNFKKYENIFEAMPDGSSPYAAKLLYSIDATMGMMSDSKIRPSGLVKILLEKTPDNLLDDVMRHHASSFAHFGYNNLFGDLHDIVPLIDRPMSEQGYINAVKIIYRPFPEARGWRDEKSLPESHNAGGIIKTVKNMVNQFSDEALTELLTTDHGNEYWKFNELIDIANNILYARHGAGAIELGGLDKNSVVDANQRSSSAYYSADIAELKAAAKVTRNKKLRQQIENKIKRLRRRRKKAAQVEKEKSLSQKLDVI